MAARMYYVCTICRAMTNSIGELHHHQMYRHTREELSWSIIILRELFDIQNALPATSLPVDFASDRNHPVHFQNYGDARQVDVPQNARDDRPLQIDTGNNNMLVSRKASLHQQTNITLVKNVSVIKPVDKYSNQVPQKQCEPLRVPVYQSAISSYKPTNLEVEFSQLPQISDESFLKSVEGICDDLSASKRWVKKNNLMYASNKTSKHDTEQPRRSSSGNSYGKKHMHGKNNNVNCQKNKVNKKQSQLITDSRNVRYEIENATDVVSICKENCTPLKTEPNSSVTEKTDISSEHRITVQNNVLKESKQTWTKPLASARHKHTTRIEQCDEKKIPAQRNDMPTSPGTRNNLMINVSNESTFLSFLNPWNNFVTFDNNQEKNKERADVFSERKTNTNL